MNLVVFDFDSTITNVDTLLPLAHFLGVENGKRTAYLYFVAIFLSFKLGLISDYHMKRFFCKLFVKGESEARIRSLSNKFLINHFNRIVDKKVFALLKSHISGGDKVYIVTSNFDFFMKPLLELIPLAGIMSTKTEKSSGFFTGNLLGHTCDRAQKLNCVLDLCRNRHYNLRIGYGDSKGDYKLLSNCERGYLVKHKNLNLINRMLSFLIVLIHGVKRIETEFSTEVAPFRPDSY